MWNHKGISPKLITKKHAGKPKKSKRKGRATTDRVIVRFMKNLMKILVLKQSKICSSHAHKRFPDEGRRIRKHPEKMYNIFCDDFDSLGRVETIFEKHCLQQLITPSITTQN